MINVLIILSCLIIISIISLIILKKRKSHCILQQASVFITIFLAICLILYVSTASIAYLHGADYEALQKFGLIRTIQAINKSPVADKGSEIDSQGNILIYYRFGCQDCEAIYHELKKEVSGKNNVYWIASRQHEGQKLLQKYTVSEVPAGVIIQSNDMYISYILYKEITDTITNETKIEFNIEGLNRLLELQQKEIENN